MTSKVEIDRAWFRSYAQRVREHHGQSDAETDDIFTRPRFVAHGRIRPMARRRPTKRFLIAGIVSFLALCFVAGMTWPLP